MPISRIKTDGIQDEAVTSAKIGDNIDLDGQFVRVPHGTTAERPGSPVAGYLRFNTDQGTLEQWNTNTNSWAGVDSPPIITSLAYTGSVTASDPAGGETITLTGTNFKTGANVTVGGTTAPTISVVNSTTITFTTPAKTAGDYDVTVINTNGLQATLTNGISYNGLPAFTTAAGNVGSIVEDVAMSTITIVAAEPDGGTLAYSVTSGALPTGVSLGSANGQITGTPNTNVTSNTTFNFTVTATDDENQTNSRAFNLIVLRPVYAASIDNSARFDDNRTSFLTRTPSSDGNRKTLTWSGWVKRSNLGGYQNIFTAEGDGGGESASIRFDSSDRLDVIFLSDGSDSLTGRLITNSVYRDTSAWIHIVYAQDTTSNTSGNRMRLYVNGSEITSFATDTNPTQNHDGQFSAAVIHTIGVNAHGTAQPFDGYLSDVHFIDGQALTPTSFAEEYYGVWVPKAYTGSYGTNGFRLDFETDSQDSSGNNNHWIPNNLGGALVKYSGSNLDYPNNLYKVLDGDNSTAASAQGPGLSTSASIIYTPPTPITVNSSLKFKYSTGQTDCKYKINGGSYVNLSSSGTVDFNTGFTGTLTSIEWYVANSNSLISIYDLRVDDVQVINYDIGYDDVSDSPTNNFATMNSLLRSTGVSITYSDGNLKAISPTSSYSGGGISTYEVNSGKWYWEVRINAETTAGSNYYNFVGASTDTNSVSVSDNSNWPGAGAGYNGWNYEGDGSVNLLGTGTVAQSSVTAPTVGDILGFAVDLDNGDVYFYHNGTAQNSGNPVITGVANLPTSPSVGVYNSSGVTFNFGQEGTFGGLETAGGNADDNGIGDFKYSVPSGFLALCAKNLSESAINTSIDDRPEDYFNIVTYSGDNTTGRSITGFGFQPDLIWIKSRTYADNHTLTDSIRGGTAQLRINLGNAESQFGDSDISFNSDGFTNAGSSQNETGRDFVSWGWKAGGAPTATNSAGAGNVPTSGSVMIDGVASTATLAGTVAADKITANTKSGFSIVSWTGSGATGGTIAHGLGKKPSMIIAKSRDQNNYGHIVWHQGLTASSNEQDNYIYINRDGGTTTVQNSLPNYWGTSGSINTSTFGVFANNGSSNNFNGGDMIAYVWAEIEGYSKIGSYVGNANDGGAFIYCGFKPAFVMMANVSLDVTWYMIDNKIGNNEGNAVPGKFLMPSQTNTQDTPTGVDFYSNGFKLVTTGSGQNQSGVTHIYMAFAEDPFKYSEAK
jgi:hypothetical protein